MEKQKKSKIWLVLCIIFLIIAAAGMAVVILHIQNRKSIRDDYEKLREFVNMAALESVSTELSETETAVSETEAAPETDALAKHGITIPEKDLDWEALREENADIYAWIYIPDTIVDYPVVQHPTDNSYYLNYNLDGTKGYPGGIYTEDYNKKDFTDIHTVIYGHNLNDKTMFSSLHNFEEKELMSEIHYIYIYTQEKVFVYEIFAAYEFNAIHLLANYNLENEYVYEQYLRDIFNMDTTSARAANIRHDIEVTKEDRIVTLSTCTSDHDSSRRYLVTGVLLNP